MITDLKCPNCGAAIPNFVGLTSTCPYCNSNIRRELDNPELKIIEQEASLGIDLLRQMKELRKEYGGDEDREEKLARRFYGFYFTYLESNRGFKKCPSCRHPSYMASRFCHICGVKFTDDGIHLPLPNLEVIAREASGPRTITLNIVGSQKQCPFCSRKMKTETTFCPGCGKLQPSPDKKKYCLQCGATNEMNRSYCVQCGHKFAK